MNGKLIILCATSLLTFLCAAGHAYSFDPLLTEVSGSFDNRAPTLAGTQSCHFGRMGGLLGAAEAISRALCNNPKTRERWANVKAEAAAVGVARAALLPSVTGSWRSLRETSVTDVAGRPQLSSRSQATLRTTIASLNWVLMDFGARTSDMRSAVETLAAAEAEEDAVLQETFATAANDYNTAQTAEAGLDVAREVEHTMRESAAAAQVRVDKGAAPISDALQAQTQLEQAVADVNRAEGELRTALGVLAADMGLRPDEPIVVERAGEALLPAPVLNESIGALIDDVRRTHPAVRVAEGRYEAAVSKIGRARADGLPSLSLVAEYSRNNQPASPGLGTASFPAISHQAYIGVQISIPFFDGFARHYQVEHAHAEADVLESTLELARDRAGLEVWRAWQSLCTATTQVTQSEKLLTLARRAYEASRRRYGAGVADILELLNTQATLAGAQQRRIRSIGDWRKARIDLASKRGQLNIADLDESRMVQDPMSTRPEPVQNVP
ncbi:TolC family protein [Caballeronia sp. M1242]|uniref:TolC family protein n=1 Tax=Caballeronia sp. M1242 TaxID=2814653 RepID=UPI0019CFACFA|nr:TolC family protein [Caballeronia sp. M1242]QSN61168.1 TolC family protein [Caballeronia sp. M1242]